MPEMRIAHLACGFDAAHSVTVVQMIGHYAIGNRLGETGPTRLALEFRRRIEQRGVATHAAIRPRFEQAAHCRAMGRLGAFVSRDLVLLDGELRTPLCIGFFNPGGLGSTSDVSYKWGDYP